MEIISSLNRLGPSSEDEMICGQVEECWDDACVTKINVHIGTV